MRGVGLDDLVQTGGVVAAVPHIDGLSHRPGGKQAGHCDGGLVVQGGDALLDHGPHGVGGGQVHRAAGDDVADLRRRGLAHADGDRAVAVVSDGTGNDVVLLVDGLGAVDDGPLDVVGK